MKTTAMLATAALALALAMASCTGCGSHNADGTDTVAAPDTVHRQAVVVDPAIEQLATTGVAVDGAMNSIYIKVGNDTVEYSYPDLEQAKRASWSIGDTVTVVYAKTADGDSVIELR